MADFSRRPGQSKPKKETSTLYVVAVSVGVVALVGLVVCCGGGYWFFANAVKIVDEPNEVDTLREEIADMEIPPEFKPQKGMRLSVGFPMTMVAYGKGDGVEDGGFVLIQMKPPGGMKPEQMRNQIDSKARERSERNEIRVKKSEQREITIDGQSVTFEFVQGTDVKLNRDVREVNGMFNSRDGFGYLMMLVNEEDWDEDKVVSFLESITVKERPDAAEPE